MREVLGSLPDAVVKSEVGPAIQRTTIRGPGRAQANHKSGAPGGIVLTSPPDALRQYCSVTMSVRTGVDRHFT